MKLHQFKRHVRVPYTTYTKHKVFLERYDKVYDEETKKVYIIARYSEDYLRVMAHLGFAGTKEGFCHACLEN